MVSLLLRPILSKRQTSNLRWSSVCIRHCSGSLVSTAVVFNCVLLSPRPLKNALRVALRKGKPRGLSPISPTPSSSSSAALLFTWVIFAFVPKILLGKKKCSAGKIFWKLESKLCSVLCMGLDDLAPNPLLASSLPSVGPSLYHRSLGDLLDVLCPVPAYAGFPTRKSPMFALHLLHPLSLANSWWCNSNLALTAVPETGACRKTFFTNLICSPSHISRLHLQIAVSMASLMAGSKSYFYLFASWWASIADAGRAAQSMWAVPAPPPAAATLAKPVAIFE